MKSGASKSPPLRAGPSDDQKMRDADELMRKGEKYLKGGFFTKPDYEGASLSFEQAATLYKSCRAPAQAVAAYKRASHSHAKNGILYNAARLMESAGSMSADPSESVQCFRSAAQLYSANDNPDKAAEVLVRGGRAMEGVDMSAAGELYEEAMRTFEESEKASFSLPTFKAALSCALRGERWDGALGIMERLMAVLGKLDRSHEMDKTVLSQVVVQLRRGDAVGAGNAFERACQRDPRFARSDEGKTAMTLLDAWEKADQEAVTACTKTQQFDFLDNEVTRVARKLVLDADLIQSAAAAAAAAKKAAAAAPAVAVAAAVSPLPVPVEVVPVPVPAPTPPVVSAAEAPQATAAPEEPPRQEKVETAQEPNEPAVAAPEAKADEDDLS